MMIDPYEHLGVSPNADDQTIREAYLKLIRLHPPDRDPEAFGRIRDAYEKVKNLQARLQNRFGFEPTPPRPIADLLPLIPVERIPAGSGPWLKLIAAGQTRKTS